MKVAFVIAALTALTKVIFDLYIQNFHYKPLYILCIMVK